MKIAWHNCYSMREAQIIVFGAASQAGSLYNGTEQAPNEIRAASLKWLAGETLQGKKFVLHPQGGPIKKKVFDAYNIDKNSIPGFTEQASKSKRIPAMLGGDHSNSLEAIRGLAKVHKSFSLIYLDAHLDLVPDQGKFYGSFAKDAFELKSVKAPKSFCVGYRAFRETELMEAKKKRLGLISAVDVEGLGVKKVVSRIKKKAGKKYYLSIDIDCVDPGNAPGVSDPVPGGLKPNQAIAISKGLAGKNCIGFDLMEVNPGRDQSDLTTMLGAKLFSEVLAGFG